MGLNAPSRHAGSGGHDLFDDQPGFAAGHAILLRGQVDLDGFRHAARRLLAQQIPPDWVRWHCSDDTGLFWTAGQASNDPSPSADLALDAPPALPDSPAVTVPAHFLRLCQHLILHRDADRFALMYRLLWRLRHEPALRHDPLDADRMQAGQMADAVRRDMHRMKAFVRFRTVQDDAFRARPEGGPLRIAWHEPEHHIVQAVAPLFARRFSQMRWAVLTPERSVDWDGARLRFGPSAVKADAPPADAGEQRWLAYYRATFSPARLRPKALQQEMPRRY